LHDLFGQLLREVQRVNPKEIIPGKALVDYGVVDQRCMRKYWNVIKNSLQHLYSGFVNPVLVPNVDSKGNIISIDVKQKDFAEQMLNYSKDFSFFAAKLD
jgi:dipeptidyl-peptidase-3